KSSLRLFPALLFGLKCSSHQLLLGFLGLASCFRLGRGFDLALLLCLCGSDAVSFGLLCLVLCFRLGRGFDLALLLCLCGSDAVSFGLVWLIVHCPWQRYWHACRE